MLARVKVPGANALARWSYALYLTHKPIAYALLQPLAARAGVKQQALAFFEAHGPLLGGLRPRSAWYSVRMEHAPLVERLPKKELASYLNLSPETLSRLKRRGKIALA